MIAFREGPDADTLSVSQDYCIRLNVPPEDREDAWDLCGVMQRLGGIEVRDCCFAFATEPRRQMALESLWGQFGPRYFEAVDSEDRDL